MKKAIVLLLLVSMFALVACGGGGGAQDDAWNTVSVTLLGMSCMSCAENVTDLLEGMGVEGLSISPAEDRVEFSYDSSVNTLENIFRVLEENGYIRT